MVPTDVSCSANLPPASGRKRRRRWYGLLLAASVLFAVGLATREGWAAWQEHCARQALAEERLDEAQSHIDRALGVHSRWVSTNLLAARIARLRGAYSEAENHLNRCGQPGDMTEEVSLEWLLVRCQRGEVDELAPPLLALVTDNHPQSAAILETLAAEYMRQTRYLDALRCLDQWLERDPDCVRALDWRGWVHNQLDRRSQAVSDYERALELQPGRAMVRLRLAQVLVETSRHPEAAPHLERLLHELPDNPDVAVALASCRVVQSRIEDAQALLDKVLKDHPDHFDALVQRGKLERTLGHAAEAEPWLRKALDLRPHDPEAHYALYQSLQGQPDRQEDAERERTRWEQVSKSQSRLARLLRKDLAAQPNDVELACEAGELLLQRGEEQRGLFWLHRALTINPRHAASRRVLLAYYERTNQPDKAAEQRRQLELLEAAP